MKDAEEHIDLQDLVDSPTSSSSRLHHRRLAFIVVDSPTSLSTLLHRRLISYIVVYSPTSSSTLLHDGDCCGAFDYFNFKYIIPLAILIHAFCLYTSMCVFLCHSLSVLLALFLGDVCLARVCTNYTWKTPSHKNDTSPGHLLMG